MNSAHHSTPNTEATPARLDGKAVFNVSIDEVASGGIEKGWVFLTLNLNDLPMTLMLFEVTDNGDYGWPDPVYEDDATYVAALGDLWRMTKAPMLLEWRGRRWLATAAPFER